MGGAIRVMRYFSMFSGIGGFEKGIEGAYGIKRACSERNQLRTQQGERSEGQEIKHHHKQLGSESINQYETTCATATNKKKSTTKRKGVEIRRSIHSGFELSAECVGFSEIDKYAVAIYQKHFPTHKNFGDATRIVPEDIPDFDFLCGGFPCQAFSIAGKRGGFEDTRGTLFFEIARIARVKRPKLLLLENVKGLLSHDSGRTFGTILATLSDMGYFCEWQVLNSKDFGVPQNRERVFIVGHLGGGSGRKVFPVGCGDEEADGIIQVNNPVHSNDRVYAKDGLSPCLNTMGGAEDNLK